VQVPQRTSVTITADQPSAVLAAYNALGDAIARTPTTGSDRTLRFTAEAGQPYVVIAASTRPAMVTVAASVPLQRIVDPEDWQVLTLGKRVVGSIDFVDDVDVFYLDLTKGQTVVVTGEATTVVPLIGIASADTPAAELDAEGPSGAGLLGTDAWL